jgi:hypothetical protein
LRFAYGVTLDLRLYLNLEALRARWGLPGLVDGRLYLAFDNLLGATTAIRDGSGARIDVYRGADEDNGRAVRLSFRKLIY